MTRHVRWMMLLAMAPVSLALCLAALGWAAAQSPQRWDVALGAIVLGVTAPVVLLVLSLRAMGGVHRRARHRRGRFTPHEEAQQRRADQASTAWNHARAVRNSIVQRSVPATMASWEVVPQPGEVFFGRVTLRYARYYGQDVSYTQHGGFYLGRPAFVLGALAVTAIANSAARSSAASSAAPQWREWQQSTVWISNRRLVVMADGRWLTFSYDAISAVYPEVRARTLVCQFHGSEPLLLTGDDAPLAAVFTILGTFGPDGVVSHPGLTDLDTEAPMVRLFEISG